MTEVSKEDKVVSARVLYIYYPLRFQKNNQNKVWALIDFGSEINAITLVYTLKLSFRVRQINVGAQKINGSKLKTFEMVLTSF